MKSPLLPEMKSLLLATSAGLLLGMAAPTSASALIIANFESASGYTAGTQLVGQQNWGGSAGTGNVTPDPLNSGYTFVINGSQSAWVNAGGTGVPRRTFLDAGATAADFYELSWFQAAPDALGATAKSGVLLYNPGSGGTAASILVEGSTGKVMLHGEFNNGSADDHDSGQTITMGGGGAPTLSQVYRFTMQFSFSGTNASMTGFMELANDLGNRTNLGTVSMNTGVIPSATYAINNYSVGLHSTGGTLGIDDIILVPEPAVTALLGVGLACVLWHRRRRVIS